MEFLTIFLGLCYLCVMIYFTFDNFMFGKSWKLPFGSFLIVLASILYTLNHNLILLSIVGGIFVGLSKKTK